MRRRSVPTRNLRPAASNDSLMQFAEVRIRDGCTSTPAQLVSITTNQGWSPRETTLPPTIDDAAAAVARATAETRIAVIAARTPGPRTTASIQHPCDTALQVVW